MCLWLRNNRQPRRWAEAGIDLRTRQRRRLAGDDGFAFVMTVSSMI